MPGDDLPVVCEDEHRVTNWSLRSYSGTLHVSGRCVDCNHPIERRLTVESTLEIGTDGLRAISDEDPTWPANVEDDLTHVEAGRKSEWRGTDR